MKKIILLLSIVSCSSAGQLKVPADSIQHYNYHDVSGDFKFTREKKTINKKVVNRSTISSRDGSKLYEKSIMVSQPGSIKGKKGRVNTFRPMASDYEVWLDGKLHKSSLRLDVKNKAMRAIVEPAGGKRRVESFKFPRHEQFCFYNQIAECLTYNGILSSVINSQKGREFFVVWDTWPYHKEMLSGVTDQLFMTALARYEGKDKDGHRIVIELAGQILLYHFSESFDLVKIAWVAQGITLLPVGQSISAEME
ncbi:MAG: hypothetical protein WDA09_01155 [Bacteriovoracaceae bacterium]